MCGEQVYQIKQKKTIKKLTSRILKLLIFGENTFVDLLDNANNFGYM